MSPTELLSTEAFAVFFAEVQAEYRAMPWSQTQLLMRRHGLSDAQDAYLAEAKMRLRRNAWAVVTTVPRHV